MRFLPIGFRQCKQIVRVRTIFAYATLQSFFLPPLPLFFQSLFPYPLLFRVFLMILECLYEGCDLFTTLLFSHPTAFSFTLSFFFNALLFLKFCLSDSTLAGCFPSHILHFFGCQSLLYNEIIAKELEHFRHTGRHVAGSGTDIDTHFTLHRNRLFILFGAFVPLRSIFCFHLIAVVGSYVGREREVNIINAHIWDRHNGHKRYRHERGDSSHYE